MCYTLFIYFYKTFLELNYQDLYIDKYIDNKISTQFSLECKRI